MVAMDFRLEGRLFFLFFCFLLGPDVFRNHAQVDG